jgi:hypothetical protein
LVPDAFLRERGLVRVVDHLGAYMLHSASGPVVFFTEGMFSRLRSAGLLGAVLDVEVEDRVLGLRDEAAHQEMVDATMERFSIFEADATRTEASRGLTHDQDSAKIVDLLRGSRGFWIFWSGRVTSDFGAAVWSVVLPLLAVVFFDASAFEMGLLGALT